MNMSCFKKSILFIFPALLLAAFLVPRGLYAAEMQNYCVVPPYVTTDVAPNIMIMMDNSEDMMNAAHGTTYSPNADKDNYIGYFKPTGCYKYQSNKFVEELISSQSYSAGQTCPSTAPLRGNLMNWATMSKYDVLQKVIIGGNTVSKQGNAHTLQSISGAWSKTTYSNCDFSVSNGGLTISDSAVGPCTLLDGSPTAIASLKKAPQKSDQENMDVRLAVSSPEKQGFLEKVLSFFRKAELVRSALAATSIGIEAGTLDATVDVAYSLTLECSGTGNECPNGTYSWSFGGLASWMSTTAVYSDQGQKENVRATLSGTPDAAGTYTFNATLSRDGNVVAGPTNFTISVLAAPLSISFPPGDNTASRWQLSVGTLFFQEITAIGGVAEYAWSAADPAFPLPAWLNICSGPANCGDYVPGTIYGTPPVGSDGGGGTYDFKVKVTDNLGVTAEARYYIEVNAAGAGRSSSFTVKVDLVEEPLTLDLNSNGIYDPGSGDTYTDTNGNGVWDGKQGVFQKYWDVNNPRARWGVTTYTKQGKVDIPSSGCIPASPASSFYTSIQNVQPSTSFPLAKGLYGVINYFGFNDTNFPPYVGTSYQGCNNSDPIDSVKCRKNFALIISSGSNTTGVSFTTNPDAGATAFSTDDCSVVRDANKNLDLVKNACYGFKNDIRADKDGKQSVLTYVVSTMSTTASAEVLEDAATAGGGKFYDASDTANLEKQLEQAFKDMLARAASGTAASVLASGEGSGANLVQAVFFPRRKFGVDEIDWTGQLTNLWYYVDPHLSNSNIREDNGPSGGDGDKVLTLKTDSTHKDHIIKLFFDSTAEATKAHRWEDTNGDTVPDSQLSDVDFSAIGNLWEAGKLLWSRDAHPVNGTQKRSIYTSLTGTTLINFSIANKTTLAPYLQAEDDAVAEAIIRYVHGEDTVAGGGFSPAIAGFTNSYRSRSVSIDGAGPKTWKLGDVLNSTPKVSSWQPLNQYHKTFLDSTYGEPGQDPSLTVAMNANHYVTTTGYRSRGMIYTGANDGMLHAFKLGRLEFSWSGQGDFDKARLANNVCSNDANVACGSDSDCTSPGTCGASSTALGTEQWAFIPKHALPYLKYTADLSYCHVYTVDLTPFIFDASINKPSDCTETDPADCERKVDSWRTILIGGMRLGGACKNKDTACAGGGTDCVKTPLDGVGYSSYFALDITEQNNPTVLWEFAHDELGFASNGPALLRMSVKDAADNPLPGKNGKWFVVLGSGPTGPIDTASQQFLGRSDQQLRLFVLDLRTGALLRKIETLHTGSAIANAFVGSVLYPSQDTDMDYQDDVMYVPFVKKDTTPGTWTKGGVLRLTTKEDVSPANWKLSKLIDDIGPVTASVTKLQNNSTNTLWTYFGTGRYFYEKGSDPDDQNGQQAIYGVKDPCFTATGWSTTCTTSRTQGDLTNVTDITVLNTTPNPPNGWYINLDASYLSSGVTDSTVLAERIITDPVASLTGVVYFTSFKPYSDECALGGSSAIWAVKYDTGGDAGTLLKGQALIQVSTGAIEQLELSQAFKDSTTGLNTGNRKTGSMIGVPPTAQGLSIISTPSPVKRVLHVRER